MYLLETPVGKVSFDNHGENSVTIQNVPSYRYREKVQLDLSVCFPEEKNVVGDIAWGGNWFYLIEDHAETLSHENIDRLTEYTWRIRQALVQQKITGEEGAEIDHIELFGPSERNGIDSRNFVLCPGKAYDRSPCGTGTSAKLACLAADGKLKPNEIWRQESIIGSVFEGSYRMSHEGFCLPRITGTAYVTGTATLILNPRDPFMLGIRS